MNGLKSNQYIKKQAQKMANYKAVNEFRVGKTRELVKESERTPLSSW